MNPYRFAQRAGRLCTAVMVTLVFTGCPLPATRAPYKKPAEINLPSQGSAQAFDQIIRDLGQFDWGPSHYAVCVGCRTARDVSIRYTGMTKDVKANAGPLKMRIVALVENSSNQDVTHVPSTTIFKANTKYLMWVHSRGDRKATWGFIELGAAYTPHPQAVGLLVDCGHKKPSPTDDADFKDCSDYAAFSGVQTAYGAPPAAAYISKAGWIGCDPDCCTGTKLEAAVQ
jgi:hypothetical protein